MKDREKAIKAISFEIECISRDCDRNCGNCDIAQDKDWLLGALGDALDLLKEETE